MPDSLEHKSSQGLTPLHLAVLVQSPPIVKILLSAGANPRTVDRYSRNLVHNLIVPLRTQHSTLPGSSEAKPLTDPKPLREILALFEQNLIKEMLLEKCSLPGTKFSSLTPLGYWMAKNEPGMYNQVVVHGKTDIIEVLANYSEGQDYELINGAGDTPVHEVSLSSQLSC